VWEMVRLYAGTVAGLSLCGVLGRVAFGQVLGVEVVAQSVLFALIFGAYLLVMYRRYRSAPRQ